VNGGLDGAGDAMSDGDLENANFVLGETNWCDEDEVVSGHKIMTGLTSTMITICQQMPQLMMTPAQHSNSSWRQTKLLRESFRQ
jgi:hypothetical protein